MKRLILCWLFIPLIAVAALTTPDKSSLTPDIAIATVADDAATLHDVIGSVPFVPNQDSVQNFGYKQQTYWVKITVQNPENKTVQQLLDLQFVPMDRIDVYETDTHGKLLHQMQSGDLRPMEVRTVKSKYHLFPLTFAPYEIKTIYIKLKNSGAMVIHPVLYDPNYFWQSVYPAKESFITAFLAIIVFFTLYNIILFFSLKEISFIYYVVAMSSMLIMQSTLFGVAYEYLPFLGLWNLTVSVNVSGALFILFSLLFVGSYFELNRYAARFEKFYRRTVLAVYIPLILLMLYPKAYPYTIALSAMTGMFMVLFIVVLSYIGYQKSPINSRYIFIGWLFSGALMIIYVCELIGFLHTKIVDDLLIRTGTLIEMVFFSFALGDKLKFLKTKATEAEIKALEAEKQMLIKARLATAGETVGNIAHQWRQPLNRLSMILLNIQSDLYFNSEVTRESIAEEAKKSEAILKDMSHTIDLFLNFFSGKEKEDLFKINDAIVDAVFIIEESLKNNAIALVYNLLESERMLIGSKSEFAQVILNLLSNAQNAFLSHPTQEAKITVSTYEDENRSYCIIEDNAGGIRQSPIDSVFEPYVSSSQNKNGSGLGLYIARTIITERFEGMINVENTALGARFTISVIQS